jgi:ABC-type sugar transport system ATPase subunit
VTDAAVLAGHSNQGETVPALSFRGIERSFGRVHALKGVDLDIASGSIHGLVGENGAGKSTILGIAAGRIPATRGTVEIRGRELRQGRPSEARARGLVAIYQELTIVPAMSVLENVFLGNRRSVAGMVSDTRMRSEFDELCLRTGKHIDPDATAGALSVAEQQMIEIMRALVSGADILLFDEPSASLGERERDSLFKVIHDLRRQSATIVFVSHNLDEVLANCDVVSVFRDGRYVAKRLSSEWNKRDLVSSMIGSDKTTKVERALVGDGQTEGRGEKSTSREEIFSARISIPGRLREVSLTVHAGEVLGVAGLVGSGRTSLLRAIAGLEPAAVGEICLDKYRGPPLRSPRAALQKGIALIPEDRKSQGLALDMSAADNIALGRLSQRKWYELVRDRAIAKKVGDVGEEVSFPRSRLGETTRWLSGGNQQKVLVARWRFVRPRVLLADEPTRGVDVGAKSDILASLSEVARTGGAVIVVSSELEEVIAVSDRVMVLAGGNHVATLESGPELTVRGILDRVFEVEPGY